ncbi:MAG TPA: hypothetical protein VNR89_13640 [Roseomonas sp.]|nr:hypothetical protein [Roseomonas sp.]
MSTSPTAGQPSGGSGNPKPGDDAPPGTASTGQDVCPDCQGSGQVNGRTCETCRGTGTVNKGIGGA